MSKEKGIKKNIMLLVGVATPLVVATARRGAQDQVPDLNAESGTTTPANSAAPAREPEGALEPVLSSDLHSQYHGTFRSPYAGVRSLQDYPEPHVSLSTALFFGLRLGQDTQLYFNPEIAGGRGFSGVTGIANFPNGEMPRVASATPTPYLARLYMSHDFGFGTEKEAFSSDVNQLAGQRPATRYTVIVGRFTITDFFDMTTTGTRTIPEPSGQRSVGLSGRYARADVIRASSRRSISSI